MTLSNLACTSLCSVIERLEVGIIILDKAQRVLHWNRWLSQRSSHTPESAHLRTLDELFPQISTTRLGLAVRHAIKDGLPSLLSPALHGTLLPLYLTDDDRQRERRMQQMIHVLPLRDQESQMACIIQISDMTATISRERLLRQQAENLRRNTTEDPLTHIPNRRKFDETLASEFSKAQLKGQPIAIAIADIDHFHAYNAHYGRTAGDAVLIELASLFRSCIRPVADLVGRYGGEEFGFILPGLNEIEACHFAENLRLRVAALRLANDSDPIGKYLSVSIGVTVMHPDAPADTHTLISSADVALYQAKHEGRNRAICFSIEDGSFKACN